MDLDFSARFYKKLSTHPARAIADGICFILIFQIVRFWIRQAGIYSSIKVPVSLFGPVIGYDMLTGPIIEIFNSFHKIEIWKILIFGLLVSIGIIEIILLCIFRSHTDSCKNKVQECLRWIRLFTFILVPLFFLPTSYDSTQTTVYSIFAFILTYASIRFIPKEIQTVSLLLGVLFTLLSWEAYFREGTDFYKTCSSQVTLIMKDKAEKLETGCWISSSDKYIVLMQGGVDAPTPKIIPRDGVGGFRFLERETAR